MEEKKEELAGSARESQKNGEMPAHAAMSTDGDLFVPGLTKREWLAGMALQGLLASTGEFHAKAPTTFGSVAAQSVRAADALLLALTRKDPDAP